MLGLVIQQVLVVLGTGCALAAICADVLDKAGIFAFFN